MSVFARFGIHPNTLTIAGLLLSVVAGVFAAQGKLLAAGIFYLIGGSLDAIDGSLARAQGKVTRFGAILDSTLDRYGESALLAGLAFWLAQSDRLLELMLVFVTLVGSIMVSYARARAEGLGLELKIGLLTRVERFIIMLITLFTGRLLIGLAVMTALVNFTVLQRMIKIYRLTRDD